MNRVESQVDEVNVTHLDTINWGRAAFPIGVDVKGNAPWLKLTTSELRALYSVLTKPLPLGRKLDDGQVVIDTLEPMADVFPGLETLAAWAKAALEWRLANPDK